MTIVNSRDSQLDRLLRRSADGEKSAIQELFSLHRSRLKQMVAVRLDQRIAIRVDASDIVQETLAEAAEKLPEYLRTQPIGFYPWLRQMAWEHVIAQHRRHISAQARSVMREEHAPLPDHSSFELAERLVSSATSPSRRVMREEKRCRVRELLAQLKPMDREVLALRYLEQLSTKETAEVLGLSQRGVKTRQRRAIERLSRLLGDETG